MSVGRVDAAMMRFVDILYALPFMIFIILLMVVFGRNILLLFLAIGAVEWLTMARIRHAGAGPQAQEFVEAAISLGLSPSAIIFKHIIPNAIGPIIVYTTLTIPSVMLLEAFLSFLGLGIQPPQTVGDCLSATGRRPWKSSSYLTFGACADNYPVFTELLRRWLARCARRSRLKD